MVFVLQANEARYSEQGKIPSLIEHSIISDIEMEDGAIRVMERKCLLEIPSLVKKFSVSYCFKLFEIIMSHIPCNVIKYKIAKIPFLNHLFFSIAT